MAQRAALHVEAELDVVTISLDAAMQSQAVAVDKVTVTLPDGSSTPGTVSSVARWRPGRAAMRRSR
jgi:hypothetical protein